MKPGIKQGMGWVVLALVAGCADAGTSTPDADVADATDTADATDSAGSADTVETADTAVDTETDATGLAFGEPCTAATECASRVCLDYPEDGQPGICSNRCGDSTQCPPEFICDALDPNATDVAIICLPINSCLDGDDDGYGFGPSCRGADCDDSTRARNPQASELCDGADDDCDGLVDDNATDVGQNCATGFSGECAAGRTVCSSGLAVCEASFTPAEESCDGRDTDCDGTTDEGEDGLPLARTCYEGPAGTLGVGACVQGVQTCDRSAFSSCVGAVLPQAETCDGIDNDCNGAVDEGLALVPWYVDADGDGQGNPALPPVESCGLVPGRALVADDCDDSRATSFPGAAEIVGDEIDQDCDGAELCFADADGDEFRTATTIRSSDLDCTDLGEAARTVAAVDCNDTTTLIYPGAPEITGNEVDENCDGQELCYVDADNDGYRLDTTLLSANISCANDGEAPVADPRGDCDDLDSRRRPGQSEICNGVDDNCDGTADEGVAAVGYYLDRDGDGFGDFAESPVLRCVAPVGYVGNNLDCDDRSGLVSPNGVETVGDGVDQDCDGRELCFEDSDGDNFRSEASFLSSDRDCADPGEAFRYMTAGDCDDTAFTSYPGAVEVAGDSTDSSCDGQEICFVDGDGDGFRSESTIFSIDISCLLPGLARAGDPANDCNDRDDTISPAASESCDLVDEDCDGAIDNGIATTNYYPDRDVDSYGDANVAPLARCSPPPGYVTNRLDCQDLDVSVRPGATETIGDEIDENCDGVEFCFVDSDGDGYRPTGNTITVSVDADCRDFGEARRVVPQGDCNDSNFAVKPSATELPADGVDQDCNGQELCYVDADNDGYRPPSMAQLVSFNLSCVDVGENTAAAPATDCNDTNQVINPGISEIPCDGIDQNCNGLLDEGVCD